jgi:UDP-glucose 4-epimerase
MKIMDIAEKSNLLQIDVTDAEVVDIILRNYKIDGVIHFARLNAVGELVENH